MVSKFKVGIIGCGLMASNHVYGYLNSEKFEIVALADPYVEAMKDFDDMFGHVNDYSPKHYTDPITMLDNETLDVVSIGVWHKEHVKWTIEAAKRNPRVILCEKPMAESLESAQKMIETCNQYKVDLIIGHQRRFLPAYIVVRDLLKNGAIGKIELIKTVSGAGLLNWATHHFDMIRFILGDIDCEWVMGAVERNTDRFEREVKIEDRAIGTFGFANGIIAMLFSDVTKDFYQGGMIYGSEGMIDLRTEYFRILNEDTSGKWEKRIPKGLYHSPSEPSFETREANSYQAKEIADLLEGKIKVHRGEAIHGYRALEMVSAIYESTRMHQLINLPLNTLEYPLDLLVDSGHLSVKIPGKYDIREFLVRDKKGKREANITRFNFFP